MRGDSHYGWHEAMEWCEENGAFHKISFGSNAVLRAEVGAFADDLCVRRAERGADKLRDWPELRYADKSWSKYRRVVARLEATSLGLDVRYAVTSLSGTAEHLSETVYVARGQAENFIKLHKVQLASNRTSCRSPNANQFRPILHTAAYWPAPHAARSRAAAPVLGACRVQYLAARPYQARRANRRGHGPHSRVATHCLSAGHAVPDNRRSLRHRRAMKSGARVPQRTLPATSIR